MDKEHKAYRTSIRKPPSRGVKATKPVRTLPDGVTIDKPAENAQRVKVIGANGSFFGWRVKEGK